MFDGRDSDDAGDDGRDNAVEREHEENDSVVEVEYESTDYTGSGQDYGAAAAIEVDLTREQGAGGGSIS